VAGAVVVWITLAPAGVRLAERLHPPDASAAYQYQYPLVTVVEGDGTIQGPQGEVSFGLTAKKDSSGATSGSCTVTEPTSKTKIKCLDVTSWNSDVTNIAELHGHATINRIATTYTIRAYDLFPCLPGSPPCADFFHIETASGYVRSGALTGGYIMFEFP
jgi:hypothetical protein